MNIADTNKILIKYTSFRIARKTTYLLFLFAVTLFFLPILMAGTDYIDDNARSVSGYYDWGSLGRFLTEGLMHLLTFSGSSMADPGRLMQILSIPVLAYAGYFYSEKLTAEQKTKSSGVSVSTILATLPLVMNPFLLPNFAFRFDCLSMILAYSLSVIAAGLITTKSKKNIILCALMVFIVAALYQPMIMMFAVVATILWVYRAVSDTDTLATRKFCWSIVAFVSGVGAYFATLKLLHFSNVGGESRGLLVPLGRAGLLHAINNFMKGIDTVTQLFINSGGKLVGLLVLLVALVGICVLIFSKRISNRKVMFIIASLPILIVSIMGPFILMDSALTYQVRTLSAAIGLILLYQVIALTLLRYGWIKMGVGLIAVVTLFSFYSLTLSYDFGNALAKQREHDKAVYDEIDDYMLNNDEIKTANLIYVGGQAGRPSSVENIIAKRPFLNRLEVANDNSTWYIWMRLRDDRVSKSEVTWYTQSMDQEAFRKKICQNAGVKVFEHPYFSVYRSEKVFIVWQHSPDENSTFCTI